MKEGILGGTFDPIHIGHLIIAEEVRLRLELDEVLFIPAGEPWLKSERTLSSGEHRLEMVKLAIGTNPYFKPCTIELERPGPSYSVDTVSALRGELSSEVQLYFVVGFDSLAELPLWKEPERLVSLCHIVAVRRPGFELDWHHLEQAIPGLSSQVMIMDVPQIEISSTEIRQRVRNGTSIRYLVPEAVERYMLEQGLYTKVGGGK
jgi:nicotinate-nucleotide adenylyltransferase